MLAWHIYQIWFADLKVSNPHTSSFLSNYQACPSWQASLQPKDILLEIILPIQPPTTFGSLIQSNTFPCHCKAFGIWEYHYLVITMINGFAFSLKDLGSFDNQEIGSNIYHYGCKGLLPCLLYTMSCNMLQMCINAPPMSLLITAQNDYNHLHPLVLFQHWGISSYENILFSRNFHPKFTIPQNATKLGIMLFWLKGFSQQNVLEGVHSCHLMIAILVYKM